MKTLTKKLIFTMGLLQISLLTPSSEVLGTEKYIKNNIIGNELSTPMSVLNAVNITGGQPSFTAISSLAERKQNKNKGKEDTTKISIVFEIGNGLIGMKRDVAIKLVKYLDIDKIRQVFGISSGYLMWKEHPFFKR